MNKNIMTMFGFKGVRAYLYAATFVLIFQMLKLVQFVNHMELASFLAVFLTIGITIKLSVFDKKLNNAKYWFFLTFILMQEIVIGLDELIPTIYYNLCVSCMLLLSLCVLYYADAPSIRRQLDDDAYTLKNACALLSISYAIAMVDTLVKGIIPTYTPI